MFGNQSCSESSANTTRIEPADNYDSDSDDQHTFLLTSSRGRGRKKILCKCNYKNCKKKISSPGDLFTHQHTHFRYEYPYQCNGCTKTATRYPGSLTNHFKNMHNDKNPLTEQHKPFKCIFGINQKTKTGKKCNMSFRYRDDLIPHCRTEHKGNHPFEKLPKNYDASEPPYKCTTTHFS